MLILKVFFRLSQMYQIFVTIAENTKIGFLKARRWRAFKKPIFL